MLHLPCACAARGDPTVLQLSKLLVLCCSWACLWPCWSATAQTTCVTCFWSHWCKEHLWDKQCFPNACFCVNIVENKCDDLKVLFCPGGAK